MSNEIQFGGPGPGRTCYVTIHDQYSGMIYSTSGGTGALETFNSGNWTDYTLSTTEQGLSNFYVANFPTSLPGGTFSVDARQQLGGAALQTDPRVAGGDINWGGTSVIPLSAVASSGQISQISPVRIGRGTMIRNFPIFLRSSADHVTPLVSGTLSGQISRDGGAFTGLQSGSFTEIGLGAYSVQALTSGDLLANTVVLMFTAVDPNGGAADPLPIAMVLQRTSGQ